METLPYSAQDIRKVVSSCKICTEIKRRFLKYTEDLIKASAPFERLSLDFKGLIPTTTKNKYLLTTVDEYSRFTFVLSCLACPDMTANSIIKCLTDKFTLFSMPNYIHTDHGSSFVSAKLREFLNNKGIAISHSTPYNPSGNGQVERLDDTLWQVIQLALRDNEQPITK